MCEGRVKTVEAVPTNRSHETAKAMELQTSQTVPRPVPRKVSPRPLFGRNGSYSLLFHFIVDSIEMDATRFSAGTEIKVDDCVSTSKVGYGLAFGDGQDCSSR